jgi:branched-chain amino acid transport system substrate-binding protein
MAATGCLAAALAFGVTACGGDDNNSGGGSSSSSSGKTVTVYSSVPLQGASRASTADLVDGAKLALEQAGGKAGDITVKYQSLDDSTAQAGSWTPEAESANALKAAQDEATAVYIGAFLSIASLERTVRPWSLAASSTFLARPAP